jgi:threonine aldolase
MAQYGEQAIVDLRSDTITQPTPQMRLVMAEAQTGDDVLGEDPTVNELEEYAASVCDTEAAIFVPSGTMANQIAIRCWCRNGDEALVPSESHVFFYEAAGAAGLSGVQLHSVPGDDGIVSVADYEIGIRDTDNDHFPATRLMWAENTHNRGGGKIVPYETMSELFRLGRERGIPVHIDGARLCNAAIATGIPLNKWSAVCDSFSLCLSKGLGAPVGSLLMGSMMFIKKARRARKALGGGMRQAGIIAAAGLYALKNNLKRLAVDHARAQSLASLLKNCPGLSVPDNVDTNILMIDISSDIPFNAVGLTYRLQSNGVKVLPVRERRIRAVFHKDIQDDAVDIAARAFERAMFY